MTKQDTISIMAAIIHKEYIAKDDAYIADKALRLYEAVEQELLNKKLGK